MPIHQITPEKEVSEYLQEQIGKQEQVVINVLNRVGLKAVNEARNNGSYIDQTGNLRSSIGYAILRNGIIIKSSSFKRVREGTKGSSKGSSFIQELKSKYGRGLVLIVVAGMDYAAYVETKRNVLQSSEILTMRLVPSLLEQLGFSKR